MGQSLKDLVIAAIQHLPEQLSEQRGAHVELVVIAVEDTPEGADLTLVAAISEDTEILDYLRTAIKTVQKRLTPRPPPGGTVH